jgi:hypothetical protein
MARDEITGLVFADKDAEWVTITRDQEKVEVAGSGRIVLPVAEVKAEDGTATVGEAVETPLKGELSALKGQITVGLPSNKLLLRTISLPAVSDDELSSMVQLQVDKFSPFPVESLVISHEILEKRQDTYLVLVAAVKQEIVETIGRTLVTGQLVPSRVDAAILGWWHVFRDSGVTGKGRELFLLMASSAPELVVLHDGVPLVFRSLGECEGMSEDEVADEAVETVNQTLMSLELEHGLSGTCSVTVLSKGSTSTVLLKKLKNACPCEVTHKSLDGLPTAPEGVARRFLEQGCAGLDLTPPAWRETEKTKLFKKTILTAAMAVLGVWLFTIVVLFGGVYVQELRLASSKKTENELHKSAKDVVTMQNRVRMIRHYMDRSKSSLECLRQISEVQPGGVDLTSFTYRKGEGVKISGEADSANLVYDFKNKLDGSRFFTGSTLDGPRRDQRRSKEMFDIDMKLPGGEQ